MKQDMREKMVVGNWKMHTTAAEAARLAKAVVDGVGSFMFRPSATREARSWSTFCRFARMRVRTCSRLHFDSSKTTALARCACSISVCDL